MKFEHYVSRELEAQFRGRICLAETAYSDEQLVKQAALAAFWKETLPHAVAPQFISATLARGYRTTTKRRVKVDHGRAGLFYEGDNRERLLEPETHRRLYEFIRESIDTSTHLPVARALNYVIIRGSYKERTLVFNVAKVDASVVRLLRSLTDRVTAFDNGVVAAFLFVDSTRSDYYLESSAPAGAFKLKKIFGHELVQLKLDSQTWRYPPTVFSQVNEAMLPLLLSHTGALLEPDLQSHFLDLYCGYGLFTLHFARYFAHAIGLELSPQAIEAAQANSRFFDGHVQFHVARLGMAPFAHRLGERQCHTERVLCDPPRQGMFPSVIQTLASRAPTVVVQACCGVDSIAEQVGLWYQAGYHLEQAVALDMFAGTAHLETLLRFVPVRMRTGGSQRGGLSDVRKHPRPDITKETSQSRAQSAYPSNATHAHRAPGSTQAADRRSGHDHEKRHLSGIKNPRSRTTDTNGDSRREQGPRPAPKGRRQSPGGTNRPRKPG